ncbi:16S rRNA (cytidine(1402)-2'-O)-methyltransferase [Plastoroseomonas hellenica]|uniref:16S rRNA (cytidine(1402)-2'-O)-methyltransferase n=1 Tax=Plastoroseomonas hellenica TaxID=2687306 RepID=UPI001BAE1A93|nr:16S rRNA (cytidine(1402)-2'-O)-methyltransferase [Plastoroseomonas hellenica]
MDEAGSAGTAASQAGDPPVAPASLPGLILVATPIGNLGDLSPRALDTLRTADAVLCEDTRVTGAMLARHGVSVTLLALHDHNEGAQAPRLIERLLGGARLALVSDAGTPLVSDPGYRLVRAAIAAGVPVGAVPGPNAAVMALTLSGLPPHPFLFLGFLPAKAAARAAEIARIATVERAGLAVTLIFYEAPHRAAEALAALAEGLGPGRPAALAREMTKRFEEVRRGTLASLAQGAEADPPRGEIVLVVGPPEAGLAEAAAEATLEDQLSAALASGLSVRDAAAMVAEATGLPRKQVYAAALALAAR